MIVTSVARRKMIIAGRRNSLPTLRRLVAGGSAPIARYPWERGRPQIASGVWTKVWGRPSKRLLNFGDGIKDPCILLICQESQEESLELLFRDMDFLPEGGCDDVITLASLVVFATETSSSARRKASYLSKSYNLRPP